MTRPGTSPSQDPGPSSPPPGFLLERGRFTPVALPPGLEDLAPYGIAPFDLNDRGQIVGVAGTPWDQASPQPTGTPPMGKLA
jgi:hypothetical protein